MTASRSDLTTVVLEMWNSFPGEDRSTFAVVGCCKPLGLWNPRRALVAEPTDADRRVWRASFSVPSWFSKVEFKWLTIDPATMEAVRWEDTPVRVLPLTQSREKVSCWFDSKGTATKFLPVSPQDSDDERAQQLERCEEEIQVYLKNDLDVEIRYEYVNSHDVREMDSGIGLSDNTDMDFGGSTAYESAMHMSNQISRVDTSLVTEMTPPGVAVDTGNTQESGGTGSWWGKALSWTGAVTAGVTAGLLAGGAYAAWKLAKSFWN